MIIVSHPLCSNIVAAISVLYMVAMSVLILLYGMDTSVIIFVMLIILGNTIGGFIVLELFFVVVLLALFLSSSTYERSSASLYLGYFSLAIGFILVVVFELNTLSIVVLLVILANLPLVSLHIWLPNVHAEASILGSIFLAGIILKASSVIFYLMSPSILYVLMPLLLLIIYVVRVLDSKVVVALSSVLHMSMSVFVISMVWYVGWLHIIVSPLMFYSVYLSYMMDSSRLKWVMPSLVILINLSFPFIGAFFAELIFSSVLIILPFLAVYVFSALFSLNLYLRGGGINSVYLLIFLLLVILV